MDDKVAASYEYCRNLHRQHGRTYYLATRLLPAWKRRHVHALYGFTRYTDEILDARTARAPRNGPPDFTRGPTAFPPRWPVRRRRTRSCRPW